MVLVLGLADDGLAGRNTIYTESNNGIGWYSGGTCYAGPHTVMSKEQYRSGDKIAMFVNFNKQALWWYRNSSFVERVSISFVTKDLQLACVLCGDDGAFRVSVRKGGRKRHGKM